RRSTGASQTRPGQLVVRRLREYQVFEFIINSIWTGPLIWMALYVSDYILTITCARLYRAQDKVVFEGSFEITPIFQADVNALRMVSPRFCLALIVSTGYLFFLRSYAGPTSGFYGFYQLVLGGMILMQATIHTRHLRNWYFFKKGVQFL